MADILPIDIFWSATFNVFVLVHSFVSLDSLGSILSTNEIREAVNYINELDDKERSIVTTWLIFEGIGRIVYYVLVFTAVFLLGRRMIQAMIAGYREAKATSV